METLQINLTEGLTEYLQTQATKHGLASPRDYLQSLLAELEQRVCEKRELEALLLEGVRAPSVIADEAFWAERRRKVLEREPGFKS